jgi:Rad3-related DNA helicase
MFRSSEQETFFKIIQRHIQTLDAPLLLEGGTGLGKTRAYLAAVSSSAFRIAIVLPTHQLIDQLIASRDAVATNVELIPFRPAEH